MWRELWLRNPAPSPQRRPISTYPGINKNRGSPKCWGMTTSPPSNLLASDPDNHKKDVCSRLHGLTQKSRCQELHVVRACPVHELQVNLKNAYEFAFVLKNKNSPLVLPYKETVYLRLGMNAPLVPLVTILKTEAICCKIRTVWEMSQSKGTKNKHRDMVMVQLTHEINRGQSQFSKQPGRTPPHWFCLEHTEPHLSTRPHQLQSLSSVLWTHSPRSSKFDPFLSLHDAATQAQLNDGALWPCAVETRCSAARNLC